MTGFFPEQAMAEGLFNKYNPLRNVVAKLSPSARQAMYAAAKKGLLVRGSWNGCAFNAGGREVGRSVASIQEAAQTFKMDARYVEYFIQKWDSLDDNDIEANRYLIEAIEEVGTHTPVVRGRRVIRGQVYKSAASKWAEELESGELTVDMIPGCEQIATLLTSV